nr:MAG TPA: hypothetical protein [Caudoviricetes sp.]DAX96176.1 MAG TPA: hypothetical protein [Bacteriophage sp.]
MVIRIEVHKMNFEEVRVGQILVDKDGNQFEVMEIDRMDDDLPVCLKLVKHIASFAVPGNEFEVMEPGQGFLDSEFWVDRELAPAQKEEFSVACIDVESLSLFVGEPKSPKHTDEVIKNVKLASLKASADEDNRNFKQSKACAEEEELRNIVHDMFVLPTPEEMRQLVMQHQLDDVSQVIRDAAKRGETSVNLPEDKVDGIGGALMAAGYQVYFTKHPQRCIISW